MAAERRVVAGVLGIGFLLAAAGTFLPWWTVTAESNRELGRFTARPFVSEATGEEPSFAGGMSDALDDEVVTVGILAAVGLVAFAGAALLALRGRTAPFPAWLPLLLLFLTFAVGALASVLAVLQWPPAWEDHVRDLSGGQGPEYDARWYGSERVSGQASVLVNYVPGPGWWLSLAGFVLAPALIPLVGPRGRAAA